MEIYGLITAMLYVLAISIILALLALIFRPSRRFSLLLLTTPPIGVVLLYLTRWWALDHTAGCEVAVPDFSKCPIALASAEGWIAFVICLLCTALAAYWAQRVLSAATYLLTDRKPLILFLANSPDSSTTRPMPESEP